MEHYTPQIGDNVTIDGAYYDYVTVTAIGEESFLGRVCGGDFSGLELSFALYPLYDVSWKKVLPPPPDRYFVQGPDGIMSTAVWSVVPNITLPGSKIAQYTFVRYVDPDD